MKLLKHIDHALLSNLWRLAQPALSFLSNTIILLFSVYSGEPQKYLYIFFLIQIYGFSDFIAFYSFKSKKQFFFGGEILIFSILMGAIIFIGLYQTEIINLIILLIAYTIHAITYLNHYKISKNKIFTTNAVGILKTIHLIALNWLVVINESFISLIFLFINIFIVIKKFELRKLTVSRTAIFPGAIASLIIFNAIFDRIYLLEMFLVDLESVVYVMYFLNIMGSVFIYIGYSGISILNYLGSHIFRTFGIILVCLLIMIFFDLPYSYVIILTFLVLFGGVTQRSYLKYMVTMEGAKFMILIGVFQLIIKIFFVTIDADLNIILSTALLGFILPARLMFLEIRGRLV